MKYLHRIILLFLLVSVLSSGALASDELIHVVGRGETIYSLSRLYGVIAADLMRVNGITDPSTLQAGRRLVIPSSNDAPLPLTNTQSLVDYRVIRGDTLFSIARTNGITLQNLLDINRFSSNHVLRAGDVIKVPGHGTTAVTNNLPVNNTVGANTSGNRAPSGLYALRWPVVPKEITYMTDQMGVVVEGEQFESVLSLTQGNVVSAGPWRKFGRVVIVETTGGYYYMYGGCETITVNVGDRITPGMELGKLGINSVSDRPQLFFMVFRNETPMDPALAPRAGNNLRT
ncbi:MAG: LysM peptidoglycan-binding domain-containing protein [Treponema sp.]|nr:LysM peptidoglycan-binding domain-containing protein [Treponema sp.]